MNKPKVQEMRVGRQTFCLVKKSDFVKLVHDAEGPYVDALEFTRRSIGKG